MYCIISYGFEKKYLAFQNTGDEVQYGYYLTDKETFMMNLSNNKKTILHCLKQRKKQKSLLNGFQQSMEDFQSLT